MYGAPQGYPPPYYQRPTKSYLGEAFITLILYYVGAGVLGLIANIIFLSKANNDQRSGMQVENKGCLSALLWVHIILGVLGCIGGIIFMALGGLAMIMESM
nr:hypothetical protein [Anaerolineae bacterium]